MSNIVQRITDYLASGGLFNPELAHHDAVRDLLMDCRDYTNYLEDLVSAMAGELLEHRGSFARPEHEHFYENIRRKQ